MKTNLKRSFPPLFDVDSYIEFHAARILLLIYRCNGIVNGRTKLAKLDFFLRYPMAIKRVIDTGLAEIKDEQLTTKLSADHRSIESQMIRYRYGPWDPKYSIVIPYLQSVGLLLVDTGKTETYQLTERGKLAVNELLENPSFQELDTRSQIVSQLFGEWNGSRLKNFIYEHFEEIASLPIGETITQ